MSIARDKITRVWAAVLRRDDFSIDEDFFDLGGDSLGAMEVITRLHDETGIELPLMAFFQEATVSHLAEVLEGLQGSATACAIVPARRDCELPLSYSQLTYWMLQNQDPASHLYNEPRALRITGKIDGILLERSLNILVTRHEILRTRFVLGDNGPIQKIVSGHKVAFVHDDVSSLASAEREQSAFEIARAESRKPFDLSQGPPFRARIVSLADHDHLLIITMHHIISDLNSGVLFFKELGEIYSELRAGTEASVSASTLQYADYAIWQRENIAGERLTEQRDYWRAQLSSASPMAALPTDRTRPDTASNAGCVRHVTVDGDIHQRLQETAREHATTLFAVLMCALRITLYRWTRQNDLVIGTVASLRSQAEVASMLGCFVNFLPLRNSVTDAESAAEVLAREKQTLLGAFAHQELPFHEIVASAGTQRISGVNLLYNVALIIQQRDHIEFKGEEFSSEFVDLALNNDTALLDMRFFAAETDAGLRLACESKTALFDPKTIDAVLHAYVEVLDAIGTDANIAVRDISVKLAISEKTKALAICASFTADPILKPLQFLFDELGMSHRIELAPYQQIFQQLLQPESILRSASSGAAVVLLRFDDFLHGDADENTARMKMQKIEQIASDFIAAVQAAATSDSTLIICMTPSSRTLLSEDGWAAFLNRIEAKVVAALSIHANVHVITSAEISDLYPVEDYEDEYADRLGNVPYSTDFYSALASILARRIWAATSNHYKAIVVDCDNTLWRGICGEDGTQGIIIGSGHRALQQRLLEQRKQGMLLCICSKNNVADVWAVLDENPNMLLKRGDFTAQRINWQPKSQNLRALAKELGLGLDSFVFLDDSSTECAEMEANCPDVLTLQVPEEEDELPQWLKHVWAFDHLKSTSEDRRRAEMYKENSEREVLRSQSYSIEEFLATLALEIEIGDMKPEDVARVAQLTQRTNQFNTTTIRRSEAEVRMFLSEEERRCLVVRVRDRFGDYGLVGAMMYRVDDRKITVESMMLSCRALGRQVEHAMLAHVAAIAEQKGIDTVQVLFEGTERNVPARAFLDEVAAPYRLEDGAGYNIPRSIASGRSSDAAIAAKAI